MPPVKQLSRARSPSRIQLPHRLVRRAIPERSPDYDKALLSFPQQHASRHLVSASQLLAQTLTRFPAHVGSAFPNLLLAIFSWLIAEFLAGCAAHVQATYPALELTAQGAREADFRENNMGH